MDIITEWTVRPTSKNLTKKEMLLFPPTMRKVVAAVIGHVPYEVENRLKSMEEDNNCVQQTPNRVA